MTDDTKEKYRMFRNLMTNELGISRTDIEAWTKEAVAGEVQKLVGQINIPSLIDAEVAKSVRTLFRGQQGYNTIMHDDVRKAIVSAIQHEIAGRIVFAPMREPKDAA